MGTYGHRARALVTERRRMFLEEANSRLAALQPDLNRMHVMEDQCDKTAALDETPSKPCPKEPSPSPQPPPQEARADGDAVTVKPAAEALVEEEEEAAEESEDMGGAKEVVLNNHQDVEDGDIDEGVKSRGEREEKEEAAPAAIENETVENDVSEEAKPESANEEAEEGKQPAREYSLPPSPEEDQSAASSPDSPGEGEASKRGRAADSDSDTPSVVKKVKLSPEEYDERERTVNEYVESAAGTSLDELQRYTDKLQQDIQTLGTLARAKELEWNSIIRLKKVKEEMFLRLQRKRQVMMIMMGSPGKLGETLDWDLSSDMRFGECSLEKMTEGCTRGVANRAGVMQQPSSTGGVSLLKSGAQLPLMMVPVVSSSPGAISSTSAPAQPHASSLKVPDPNAREKGSRTHRPILPKPVGGVGGNNGQNPVIGEGRQGPILDVRSIIADYRSRHPETVPRRGRRMKSSSSPTRSSQLTDNLVSSTRVSGGGGILSMASLALGSGSQMRTGLVGSTSAEMGELGFLLNAVGESARQDSSRPSSADSSRSGAPSIPMSESANASSGRGISFKDVLVQFAKLSQTERHDPAPPPPSKPPPYPEVTLHPVLAPHSPPQQQSPSSSLLHGILTKSAGTPQPRADSGMGARPTTFSPTLARLLTAPERLPSSLGSTSTTAFHGTTPVSINDLLSTSKTRNEITITPVASQQSVKAKEEVVLLEEEDSADRLVIDESGDMEGSRSRADDQGLSQEISAEDVPECQGCHQKAAQFVCAGCGNQWYCSRDCQVTAWDDHSEVCSG